MHSEFYHNSHLSFYRSPFGAVECGTTVTLRISAPVTFYGDAILRLWIGDRERLIPMNRTRPVQEDEGDYTRIFFEVSFDAPQNPGLVWYYFCMGDDRSTNYYGNGPSSLGGEGYAYDHAPSAYQITTFRKTETPKWWKEGIIYQIFPDRFRNGNEDGSVNCPKKNSLLQARWDDLPSYQKDQNGNMMSWVFAGGNFKGITEKLDYIKEMGFSIVYLNPVFEAQSNHRYDTANYKKLDPVLGTDEEFDHMIAEGKKRGISFLFDGVFSHTGQDSVYFNKNKTYGEGGAYHDPESPYRSWYKFKEYPHEYECWWNVPDLPNVNEMNASYLDFICHGEDSVIRTWLRRGVMGFRLDVADELPDAFIRAIRKTMQEENPDAILIGEVWEDASNKQSYNLQREYYYGEELDGVMNYPFREVMLGFCLGHMPPREVAARIMSIIENYPKENLLGSMTLLGSHDRPRSLTVLGEACSDKGDLYAPMSEQEKRYFKLSPEAYGRGVKRLKLLTALQMVLPGTPSVYYGDEAGMQGFMDPYNRGTYPWGKEDTGLREWFACMLNTRREILQEFTSGKYFPVVVGENCLGLKVKKGKKRLYVYVNRHEQESCYVEFAAHVKNAHCMELMEGKYVEGLARTSAKPEAKQVYGVTVPPGETRIYRIAEQEQLLQLEKSAGILLHPTSLGGSLGVGDLGERAYGFVDFLHHGKQKIWQILPLNPCGGGDSPYQTPSCFAGNPLLISMEKLSEAGLLTKEELKREQEWLAATCKGQPAHVVHFGKVGEAKERLLRLAFARYSKGLGALPLVGSEAHTQFLQSNVDWLEDYTIYVVAKGENGGASWQNWKDQGLVWREKTALEAFKRAQKEEIAYHTFVQLAFYLQWMALRRYAKEKGVSILGDVPIYVAADSADVWRNPHLFKLDAAGNPAKVAGCPPDFFTEDGQLWGTPVFNWEAHRDEDFAWWKKRLGHGFRMQDYVRLDHFRGFAAYWEVDAKEPTARNGAWRRGGGIPFFRSLEEALGTLPVVAEDLGHITFDVRNLRNNFNYPGMEIYQFSEPLQWGQENLDYLRNIVVYTGTHDNETMLGWRNSREEPVDGAEAEAYVQSMAATLYKTPGIWVVLPLQDVLALDNTCRMNTPGTVGPHNWTWKLTDSQWAELQGSMKEPHWLARLVEENGR